MEEKIESKINAILDCIISKPTAKITADDYMILSAELKDIRFRKSQAESGERIRQLMDVTFPGFTGK